MKRYTDNQELWAKYKALRNINEVDAQELKLRAEQEDALNMMLDREEQRANNMQTNTRQQVMGMQDIVNKYLPQTIGGLNGLGVQKSFIDANNTRYTNKLTDVDNFYNQQRNNLYANYRNNPLFSSEARMQGQQMYNDARVIDNAQNIENTIAKMEQEGKQDEIYDYLKSLNVDELGIDKAGYNQLLAQYQQEKEIKKSVNKGKKNSWKLLEEWARQYNETQKANR